MTWRLRAISTVLLVALAGLPLAGLSCAIACASDVFGTAHASTGSSHHGSKNGGEVNCDAPPKPGEVQLRGTAEHDCDHDATIRQDASFAADRADTRPRFTPVAIELTGARVSVHLVADRESTYRRPPGTDPPTRTPLVLRV